MNSTWKSLVANTLVRKNRWRMGRDAYPYFALLADRRPRRVPEAYWRSISGMKFILRGTSAGILLGTLAAIIGLVFDATWAWSALDAYGTIVISGLVVVHCVVGAYGGRYTMGKYRRFLIKNDWRVCIRCSYILHGLPPAHRCPECALEYEFESLRKHWERWLESNVIYE